MNRPASPRKRPIKIKLTGKEHGFYSNMWTQASGADGGKVGGKDAVMFFKKSNLPVEKLKNIWRIAARTSNEHLVREEFYVALRLIAYEQNGILADESTVSANVEVALPQLT